MSAGHVLPIALLAALLLAAREDPLLPVHDGVGGDFSAPSSLGRDASLSEFRGKVVLLFFGYTSCQDVCPATLAHLKALSKRLGPAEAEVQVLLVTVDPETDTPARLREYLARFHPRFVGFSGTREQIDGISRLFMAGHQRSHGTPVTMEHSRHAVFAEHAYLYSHAQQIYLLDRRGRTRALFFVGTPLDEMQAAVAALLAEPAAEREADGESGAAPPGGADHAGQDHSKEDER